jgi:hypothetical protein
VDVELAILINGQAMTSMNGSSRSQGEVHERVMDEITKDDEVFITTLVNEKLLPLLRDVHKYPFEDGDVFELDQPEDLQALLKIYTGVNQMGFQLDMDEVSKRFKVKITGLKQVAPVAPAPGDAADDDDDPDGDEDQDTPDEPKKGSQKPKGAKKAATVPEDDDEELKAADLIKLHAEILKLYAHVH